MHKFIRSIRNHGSENYYVKHTKISTYISVKENRTEEIKPSILVIDSLKFIQDVYCVDFDRGGSFPCVYMIGGFYIGSTSNLRARLIGHARECINGKHFNIQFQEKFINCLRNGVKMPVSVLSFDKHEELAIIKKYSEIYQLCNVTGIKNKV